MRVGVWMRDGFSPDFTGNEACGPISSSVGLCGPATFSPKAPAFVRLSTVGARAGTGRSVPGPMSSSDGFLMRDVDCAYVGWTGSYSLLIREPVFYLSPSFMERGLG